MALMQPIPEFRYGGGFEESGRVVPVLRQATKCEFRRGGSLNGVLEAVKASKLVEVVAAPAAGKSTKLPGFLASTGVLVVHVVPYPLMAVALQRVVGGVVVEDVSQPWPESGVALVSAGCIVAKWLEAGAVVMPACYVLHDESHESGAASGIVRALMPTCESVLCCISTSATPGVSEYRKMESGGITHDMNYEAESFADPWSVEEFGAPWAVHELNGHTMVFEDDKRRAAALVQAYNLAGATAYRLHSRTTREEFEAVLRTLENPLSPYTCVLIVDSTFRSSYTLPVTTVVDSGLVKRVVVSDGKIAGSVRPIYEAEMVQTRARVARQPNSVGVYWRPRRTLEKRVCDLEQADVEAAALIFRALGFLVPTWAATAKMADGPVPRDMCGALRGVIPLAAIPEMQLEVPSCRSKFQQPEFSSVLGREPVPSVFSVPAVPPPVPEVPVLSSSGSQVSAVDPTRIDVSDVTSALTAMATAVDVQPVVFGRCYYVDGVSTVATACANFSNGVETVKRLLQTDESCTMEYAWSSDVRSVAVNCLVAAYNKDIVEFLAYSQAVREVRSLSVSPVLAKEWAVEVAERMTNVAARAEYVLRLAERVAYNFCRLVECDALLAQEVCQLANMFIHDFRARTEVVNTRNDEAYRIQQWSAEVDKGGGSKFKFLPDVVEEKPRWDFPPMAKKHSGYGAPRFVRWAGGDKYRRRSKSSTSSTMSK